MVPKKIEIWFKHLQISTSSAENFKMTKSISSLGQKGSGKFVKFDLIVIVLKMKNIQSAKNEDFNNYYNMLLNTFFFKQETCLLDTPST